MQKKKILFLMESLRIGGAEKSLLTLLSLLDTEQYDISLFLFRHNGELMGFLPQGITLLPEDKTYRIFDSNWKTAPFRYLLRGDWKRFWHSACYIGGCIWQRITRKPLYIGWNHVRHLFDQHEFQTDIAVAYLERKCIYLTAEQVQAKRKIGFIHNDYSVYPYDAKLDHTYFSLYDHIATVSDHCKDVLVERFPEYSEKFVVIKNMVSVPMIQKMAQEPVDGVTVDPSLKILVTVGRLVPQKGYDIAVQICEELIRQGKRIRWFAVGDGPEREALQQQIDKAGLHDVFILVGAQTNPYKWMNLADVYVQPSRFEGFGITVAEAKTLGKPIVCSDIPEFREQLQTYLNCGIACGISQFVSDIENFMESGKRDESVRLDNSPLFLFQKLICN